VDRVEIAESSGFDILDEAAVKAVKRWQFVPGTAKGKRIAQWVVVPVRFSLE
jgi:protein TonB